MQSTAKARSLYLEVPRTRCSLVNTVSEGESLTMGSPGEEPAAMVIRPPNLSAYEFVVLSALRAQQLIAGCTPSVAGGEHSATTMAQMEVAGGYIVRSEAGNPTSPRQCGWQR